MEAFHKQQPIINNINDRSTLILNNREGQPSKKVARYRLDSTLKVSKTASERSTLIFEAPPESKQKPKPTLSLNNKPIKHFENLTQEKLWHELFNRLLKGEINRVDFKLSNWGGSIVCYENDIARISIDNLDGDYYQYLIKKLKDLNNLPETPIEKTKKFEMQRWYKEERILLCSQLTPGDFAEEGNLQILRGTALEFYQQQQMDELARDALKLSKQLERKLKQIQVRSRINPQRSQDLGQLKQIEQKIARSLKAIEQKMNL